MSLKLWPTCKPITTYFVLFTVGWYYPQWCWWLWRKQEENCRCIWNQEIIRGKSIQWCTFFHGTTTDTLFYHKKLYNSLQILQNKLARVLLSADIYTPILDMMDTLHWDKLCERWNRQILIIVFKFLKNDAPSYLSRNFIFTSSIHSRGTRSQSFNTLVLPSWYNNSGKHTFQYRGAFKWNTLSSDIRSNLTSMSLNMFKSYISNNWISCNHSCNLFTRIYFSFSVFM